MKQIPYTYTVISETVLEFEYHSDRMGDIKGVIFENDNSITPADSFWIYGNQIWGIGKYDDYSGTGWKRCMIPADSFFTGNFNKLVFIGDDDYFSRQTSCF